MTGTSQTDGLGTGWMEAIHPDDRAPLSEKWQASLGSGETFEIEYRLHDAVKGYRWYLDRAIPLRNDKGAIQQWFGTCTDIDDQKHNQQILEEAIKERTEELADANTHLQEEMLERDHARRELDEQNAKMLQDLTDRSQRATLLAKMGELLQSCLTKDEVFAAALGFAPRIFPTSRGAMALLSHARDLVEVAGTWHDCQLPVTVFEPSACWALRTGHPHLVVAGDTTAPCASCGRREKYLPLHPDPCAGAGHRHPAFSGHAMRLRTLADAELSFKTTFAGQVGLSVANIRLREALHSQSIKDPLTGLYNRRYLDRDAGTRNPARHPRRATSRHPHARPRPLQEVQRYLRPRRGRYRVARNRGVPYQEHPRRRYRLPLRRRGVRRHPPDCRLERSARPGRAHSIEAPRIARCFIKGNRWG